MMLSAIPPQSSLSNPNFHYQTNCNLLFNPNRPQNYCSRCRATLSNASSAQRPLSSTNSSTSPSTLLSPVSSSRTHGSNSASNDNSDDGSDGGGVGRNDTVPSASAVAAIIRKVSASPVEFVQRIERADGKNKGDGGGGGGLVVPSADFQRLCLEQLDLFRRFVHPDALLSVYVRPAGSYVMDQLECATLFFIQILMWPI